MPIHISYTVSFAGFMRAGSPVVLFRHSLSAKNDEIWLYFMLWMLKFGTISSHTSTEWA